MKHFRLCILLIVLLLTIGFLGVINQDSICQYATKVTTSDLTIYNVLVECEQMGPFGKAYSMGSGVVISEDGLIMTAKHVLEGSISVRVTLHNGEVYDVNDFYVDDKYDVGFIKLPCKINDFASLADSNDVEDDCAILHVGNPGGIRTDVMYSGTVETSKFRRIALDRNACFILAKMVVLRGCSGGGVYYNGKLIGITVIGVGDYTILVSSNMCKEALERYNASFEG